MLHNYVHEYFISWPIKTQWTKYPWYYVSIFYWSMTSLFLEIAWVISNEVIWLYETMDISLDLKEGMHCLIDLLRMISVLHIMSLHTVKSLGNRIVYHSDVVRASPVGTAPTTSSFLTLHMASLDWTKTTFKIRWETLKWWDLMYLILDVWWYIIFVKLFKN